GRAGNTRVHLNDDETTVFRVHSELNVGAAGVDTDLSQNGDRGVAHDLIFLISQRLSRRHGDGVTGVDTHRVEVFNRANDDAVVFAVADNFHFVFFPAEQGLFNQEFVCRGELKAAGTNLDEFFHVVRNTAA